MGNTRRVNINLRDKNPGSIEGLCGRKTLSGENKGLRIQENLSGSNYRDGIVPTFEVGGKGAQYILIISSALFSDLEGKDRDHF